MVEQEGLYLEKKIKWKIEGDKMEEDLPEESHSDDEDIVFQRRDNVGLMRGEERIFNVDEQLSIIEELESICIGVESLEKVR